MSMLGATNPALQSLSQIAGMIKAAKDPMAAINNLAQQDTRMQQVMQYINQNGGNAEAAFYNLAKEKGVDPKEVLSQIQTM